MAAGLAMLNNVPGEPADLIREHDLGITVPPRDAEAMASAISLMLDEPATVANWMNNSARAFAGKFRKESSHAQFELLLSRLVATR